MQVQGFDERGFLWEADDPIFVVVLHDGGGESGRSFATDTNLLTECGLLEAIRWAQENVEPDGCWLLGLVDEKPDPAGRNQLGFTYLEGYDPNFNVQDMTPWQRAQLEAMLSRGARPVLRDITGA